MSIKQFHLKNTFTCLFTCKRKTPLRQKENQLNHCFLRALFLVWYFNLKITLLVLWSKASISRALCCFGSMDEYLWITVGVDRHSNRMGLSSSIPLVCFLGLCWSPECDVHVFRSLLWHKCDWIYNNKSFFGISYFTFLVIDLQKILHEWHILSSCRRHVYTTSWSKTPFL